MNFLTSHKNKIAWIIRRRLLARPRKNGKLPDNSDPVVVAGLFSTANGLGRAARGTYKALTELGIDSIAIDLSPLFGVSDLALDIPTQTRLPRSKTGTLILHLNGPEVLDGLYAMGVLRPKSWRVIGYWSWELTALPSTWLKANEYLTEIWTLSQFCKSAIEQRVDLPVKVVPPLLPPIDQQQVPAYKNNMTNCLIMADARSSFERKNVMGSIDLFQKAFPDRQQGSLIVKLQNFDQADKRNKEVLSRVDSDKRIRLETQKLTDWESSELIRSADIILSAHRSEGFGLHLAEGMALGKLIVCTDWSGNTDFTNQSNSLPISSSLIPVTDTYGVYEGYEDLFWAHANVDQAADDLSRILQSPQQLDAIINQAKIDIQAHCSIDKYYKAFYKSG